MDLEKLIRSRARLMERGDDSPSVQYVNDLSAYDRSALELRYGPQPRAGSSLPCPRPIAEIRTLTEYEKDIFDRQDLVSPNFCLQFLYKMHGEYRWQEFQANVEAAFRDMPELRVNFFPLGLDQKMHKIVFKERAPAIRFLSLNCLKGKSLDRTLRTIMEIDQRNGFDLEIDVLARITIIHTAELEYAILLTESRLVANAWKPREFLEKAWGLPLEDAAIEEPEEDGGADGMDGDDEEEATAPRSSLTYWQAMLGNLPPVPRLPGFRPYAVKHKAMRHSMRLNYKDAKTLLRMAQDNRDLAMTVLHTAWGMLVRHVNYCRETYFCLLMPDSGLELSNADKTASRIRPLPIRLSCEEGWRVREIVERQWRQMLKSQTVLPHRMSDLLEDIGQTRDMFPFYLHFHGFTYDKECFSGWSQADEGCHLVDMSSWDADKRNLSVHFDMDQDDIFVTFAYNLYCFESYSVEPLARFYGVALHLMLLAWDQDFAVFDQRLKKAVHGWDRAFKGVAM